MFPVFNFMTSFFEDVPLFIKARNHGVFCAHNATFENQLLCRYCPVLPGNVTWGPWIDTYGLYKNYLPKGSDCQLGHLVNQFGLENELKSLAEKLCPTQRCRYHCALYDTIACALLLLYYIHLPQNQSVDLETLLLQSAFGSETFNDRNQQQLF